MARRAKRGFATVVKEKSDRYSVRFTTPDGVRKSAGQTFAHKADAEAWAAAKRRELDKPAKAAQHERVTFADYARTWLEHRHVNGRPIKPRTREHYQKILDDQLIPGFGAKRLDSITTQNVRDWYAHTLTNAPTLRSHTYGLLHAVMRTAFEDDLIDANPCRIRGAGSANRAKPTVIATINS